MAIVVESTASASTSTTSLVITKPTGLAVGDLMVAVLSMYSNTFTDVINTASGWTLAGIESTSGGEVAIQYKYADSSDVAASNFTFTSSGTPVLFGGSILRVSGAAAISPLQTFDGAQDFGNDTSAMTFATDFTPTTSGCLLVTGFLMFGDPGTGTVSSYFVTGSSPTWTELYDYTIDSGTDDEIMAGAYAIQSDTNQITAFGATISIAKDDKIGVIAVFLPRVDVTVTNAPLEVQPAIFAPTMSNTNVVTNALLEVSPTITDINAVAKSITVWSNDSKPTSTWTNEQKP